jgi:hypothetical protein
LPGPESTKDLVEETIPGLCCPNCGRLFWEWGLTGPFVSDRVGKSLHGGVWKERNYIGSVANNIFNLKKVEYPIIAKTRCVVFTGFFEFVGE